MNEIPEFPRDHEGVADFSGYRMAFFGGFSYWPAYHRLKPNKLAKKLGAEIADELDDRVDFLVLGNKRAKGRAEALKQHKKMTKEAQKQERQTGDPVKCPVLMPEEIFCELTHRDITGKTFHFYGEFGYCPKDFEPGRPETMAKAAGGLVREELDDRVDFLVVPDTWSEGVREILQQAKELQDQGSGIRILEEDAFLDLIRKESIQPGELDFSGFVSQLLGVVDPGKLTRALKMLKEESFQLFVEVEDDRLVGVVRSQTGGKTLYSPFLTHEGFYGCGTAKLNECMGLQGSPCKHLLVLLLGLARGHAGQSPSLDPAIGYNWIRKGVAKRPKKNSDLVADTFLRYKGAEAGEVDWRPVETVPEDYYAF